MKITVVGTGYVGLVTGACFAEMGNQVTCVDMDVAKVERLARGDVPIYEPRLNALVAAHADDGLLQFTTSIVAALDGAEFVLIAVGTPTGEDGSADLRHVLAVAADIGRHMQHPLIVVDKSTVPVGTADKVRAVISDELQRRGVELAFDVVSNPEFLKEGAAIDDFLSPDRVIVGTDDNDALRERMSQLYRPFLRNHDRMLFMGVRDAEMTKYAANAMLATKISFMNEIANLCEHLDVDVENVRRGIGSDGRIGYSFIYPGCGYGGSCFPKDVKAVIRTAREHGFDPMLLESVERRNADQKRVLFRKVTDYFGDDLAGRRFGLWGLAFKPGTDDMREASSLVLIRALVEAGATVEAYDPVALETARAAVEPAWIERGQVAFSSYQYDVLKDADAMLLVTEWKRFRQPDFPAMKDLMKQAVIFDGRNQYDPAIMSEHGFRYFGIGRTNQQHSGALPC